MKQIFLMMAAALVLSAADATGTWTGKLIVPGEDGGTQDRSAHLVLKQEGATLTGTAGPDESEQHAIRNGKIEDGVLTFEVQNGETVMKFNLKQDGEEIAGDISRERDGETQRAKIAVKRQKA